MHCICQIDHIKKVTSSCTKNIKDQISLIGEQIQLEEPISFKHKKKLIPQ
jgi:hypothetical protein